MAEHERGVGPCGASREAVLDAAEVRDLASAGAPGGVHGRGVAVRHAAPS